MLNLGSTYVQSLYRIQANKAILALTLRNQVFEITNIIHESS